MVLVDTGSTDNSIDIATGRQARVFRRQWDNNFSKARNFGLEQCGGQWVLWLDADDRLLPDTSQWFINNVSTLSRHHVYLFSVKSPQADGSTNSFDQIRLVPNGLGLFFTNPIHESLSLSIKQKALLGIKAPCEILHVGYSDEASLTTKIERNLNIMTQLAAQPAAPTSILFSLARTIQVRGDVDRANDLYERIIQTSGSRDQQEDVYLASHIYLGQCKALAGHTVEAVTFFKKNLDLGSHNPQYMFEFGKVEFVLGNFRNAAKCLESALSLPIPPWTIPTDWDSILDGAREVLRHVRQKLPEQKLPEQKLPEQKLPEQKLPEQKIPKQDLHKQSHEHRAPVSEGGSGPNLSVCMIVKNEEQNLKELAAQIPGEQVELIVVDTGSSDGTLSFLKENDINTYHYQWNNDFSAARNFSLNQSDKPWLLWLDADDRLPDGFWEQVRQITNSRENQNIDSSCAYRFIVESPRDTGEREAFRQIRLFPNNKGIQFTGKVHEQLGTSLKEKNIPVEDVDITIIHTGYELSENREKKLNRNFTLMQDEIKEHPKDPVVNMEMGNCHYQRGEYKLAIEFYKGVLRQLGVWSNLEVTPAQEDVKIFPELIANAYDKMGESAQAQKWYDVARHWNPGGLFSWYWLAKKALDAQDYPKALELFRIIKSKPIQVSRFASDNTTIRRNVLGYMVLLEQSGGGALKPGHPSLECLKELIDGGLQNFPLDYKIPVEVFEKAGALEDLLKYFRLYLSRFNNDMVMWENYLEQLMINERYSEVLETFENNPDIHMSSGVIEAFRGKCLNALMPGSEEAYKIYIEALHTYSGDPTLLVYFTEWMNDYGDLAKAYGDLQNIKQPSADLGKLLAQLKAKISNGGVGG